MLENFDIVKDWIFFPIATFVVWYSKRTVIRVDKIESNLSKQEKKEMTDLHALELEIAKNYVTKEYFEKTMTRETNRVVEAVNQLRKELA